MSKFKPSQKKLVPKEDYWMRFLEEHNLVGIASEETETESSSKLPSMQPVVLTPDQWTFIFRVAEALVDVGGYSPDIKKKLFKVREMYRQGLEKVFKEEMDFDEWFVDTRRKCNLKEVELAEKLYDALDGLRSEESRTLREQLGRTVEQLKMARAGMLRV